MNGKDYKILIIQKQKHQYEIANELGINPIYLCMFLNNRKRLDRSIIEKLDKILEVT